MKKFLSGSLIIIGMAILTTTILIFLEMTVSGRIALFIAQYLMEIGMCILLFDEKKE